MNHVQQGLRPYGVLTSNIHGKQEQVKPGFTNYQPRGLANQIKFEV